MNHYMKAFVEQFSLLPCPEPGKRYELEGPVVRSAAILNQFKFNFGENKKSEQKKGGRIPYEQLSSQEELNAIKLFAFCQLVTAKMRSEMDEKKKDEQQPIRLYDGSVVYFRISSIGAQTSIFYRMLEADSPEQLPKTRQRMKLFAHFLWKITREMGYGYPDDFASPPQTEDELFALLCESESFCWSDLYPAEGGGAPDPARLVKFLFAVDEESLADEKLSRTIGRLKGEWQGLPMADIEAREKSPNKRLEALAGIADLILRTARAHPLIYDLLGTDGRDGSGKPLTNIFEARALLRESVSFGADGNIHMISPVVATINAIRREALRLEGCAQYSTATDFQDAAGWIADQASERDGYIVNEPLSRLEEGRGSPFSYPEETRREIGGMLRGSALLIRTADEGSLRFSSRRVRLVLAARYDAQDMNRLRGAVSEELILSNFNEKISKYIGEKDRETASDEGLVGNRWHEQADAATFFIAALLMFLDLDARERAFEFLIRLSHDFDVNRRGIQERILFTLVTSLTMRELDMSWKMRRDVFTASCSQTLYEFEQKNWQSIASRSPFFEAYVRRAFESLNDAGEHVPVPRFAFLYGQVIPRWSGWEQGLSRGQILLAEASKIPWETMAEADAASSADERLPQIRRLYDSVLEEWKTDVDGALATAALPDRDLTPELYMESLAVNLTGYAFNNLSRSFKKADSEENEKNRERLRDLAETYFPLIMAADLICRRMSGFYSVNGRPKEPDAFLFCGMFRAICATNPRRRGDGIRLPKAAAEQYRAFLSEEAEGARYRFFILMWRSLGCTDFRERYPELEVEFAAVKEIVRKLESSGTKVFLPYDHIDLESLA